MFNIYINDLFYFLTCDICNFADDTTPYVCNSSLEYVLEKLEEYSALAMEWFEINEMKMNAEKCHLFISGNKIEQMWVRIRNDMIWENRTGKLLEITIDNGIEFEKHLTNICIKANRKLTVLTRMRKYLDFNKVRLLFKSFFESQFKYCPLTWMFYSRKTNNRINKLHERALRLVYSDYESTFEDLLTKDGSFTVHHYNIQTLAIELYKVYNNISQTIFGELFTRNNNGYYLRSKSDFVIPQIRTVLKGSNSIRYFGPIIWNLILEELKNITSLNIFKKEIRRWKPKNCPCRICRNYVHNLGFVELFE